MSVFQLNTEYSPRGDQDAGHREAGEIRPCREPASDAARRHRLGQNLHDGECHRERGKPALVFSHNKTLAAQLYSEFKNFFPTTRWSTS
jgi:excinuclease ABC subunit B